MRHQKRQILIISHHNDPHALSIQKAIRRRGEAQCHVVECDNVAGKPFIDWEIGSSRGDQSLIRTSEKRLFEIEVFDAIWWRRGRQYQLRIPSSIDSKERDYIQASCVSAFMGGLLSRFRGHWISHPVATDAAENKLVQLEAARRVGLAVPSSLVTQDIEAVRRFYELTKEGVVVKSVKTFAPIPLLAVKLTKAQLASKRNIQLCPTLYQEYIPGTAHIRAHVFGHRILSVSFKSEYLDWRESHSELREMKPFVFDKKFESRLIALCNHLQLEMGILDFKISHSGDIVFLDLNPQGQFLFIQGMSGMDLISEFSQFLCERAQTDTSRYQCHDRRALAIGNATIA